MAKPIVVVSVGDDGFTIQASPDVEVRVLNYVRLQGDREDADATSSAYDYLPTVYTEDKFYTKLLD